MKKTMRTFTAIMMSAALAVSASSMFAFTAAADDTTYTITMSTSSGHTYTAYQVFAGTLHEDTSTTPATKTLSDITWGSGVNYSTLITALKADTTYGAAFTSAIGATSEANAAPKIAAQIATYTNASDVKALAKIIGKHVTGSGTSSTSSAISGLSAGYYLIKDTTATGSVPQGDTISEFMLEVVSNVSVTAKDESVVSTKTVTETDDATPTVTIGQKFADYDIGDSIPYTLTFKLPSKYADYVNYPVTFTDDMCAGLTWDGSATIHYGASDTTGTTISFTSNGTSSYTGGTKWTYTSGDLKATSLVAGDVITITYNATLNTNAAVNNAGNPNKYHVTFYSDPNISTTPTGGETPPPTPPTNDTPDDTTVVFTYELVFNKVDGGNSNAPLTGADFKLEKSVGGTWTDVTALHSGTGAVNPTKTGTTSNSTFTFHGLDSGSYKLTEITTPNGYNTISPIEFTVTRTNDTTVITGLSSTGLTMTPTFNDSNAKLTANIENNQGVILPGTGGIGTTPFYVIGALFICGGITLLIVKKRMKINETNNQ